ETSITGGDGADTITGHDDGANINGGAGNDQLTGGTGDDTLSGGDGDDTISGSAGADSLSGGAGDDQLNAGSGTQQSTGGSGASQTTFGMIHLGVADDIDTYESNVASEGVTDLLGTFGGSDDVLFEHIVKATMENENGDAVQGDDDYGATPETVTIGGESYFIDSVQAYDATVQFVDGSEGSFTAVVIQMTNGDLYLAPPMNTGADATLLSSGAINSISLDSVLTDSAGLSAWRVDLDWQTMGGDTLEGGAGDDTLAGGSGQDTAVYSGDVSDFDVSYNAATETFTITDGNASDGLDEGTDSLTDIETFEFNGTSYDASDLFESSSLAADVYDYDTGSAAGHPATFTGGSGSGWADLSSSTSDEVIYAREGNDTLDSGSGDDVIYGGAGNDVIRASSGDDTLFGGTGNDSMSGGDGNDTFYVTAMQGDDTIDGGSGWTDIIELAGFGDDVVVDGNTIDGEGWTIVLDSGHSVSNVTLDSIELSADAVGTISFDDGGMIDFSGIDRVTF
ncbi:MAG: calcium-binding protein, partial [Pseudomonadota bacterium]